MLRVSKLTDYATVVMSCLADAEAGFASAQQLADDARLELPTVSKLLKQLAHAGLVVSQRGASGGYRLARRADRITVADIVVAMEGPIGMTECGAQPGLCDRERHCGVRVNWQQINRAIASALDSVTLADLTLAGKPRRPAAIALRVASV